VHRHLRIIGTVMKSRTFEDKVAMTARFWERWHSAFGEGALKPIVDRVFPLERAVEAHCSMEASENFGKIILAMDEASHAKP
jgi:NADPH:quinone reductase